MAGVDLDLSDLIPNKLIVRAGDKDYRIRAELTPAQRIRVSRWWAMYGEAFEPGASTDGKVVQNELWSIVQDILGTATSEEAAELGSAAAVKLFRFLLNAQDARNQRIEDTTTSSEPPSVSPSTSTEASPSAIS